MRREKTKKLTLNQLDWMTIDQNKLVSSAHDYARELGQIRRDISDDDVLADEIIKRVNRRLYNE